MKKYLFGMIALVCAIAFASFTTAKKQTLQKYKYTLGTSLGVFNASNWSVAPSPTGCGEGNDLPCVVEIDLDVYNQGGLSQYLAQFSTIAQIKASPEFREAKPEE